MDGSTMRMFHCSVLIAINVLQANAQWHSAGLSGASVHAIFQHGSALFAGTADSGVYRSTNNGASWVRMATGLSHPFIKSFAVIGSTLFAGSNGGGVFISSNNGDSWVAVNNGLTSVSVQTLAVSGTHLFAGTNGAGVFRSTNSGTTWTVATNGLTNTAVHSLTVSGSELFAGTDGGVFRSTNFGDSWTLLSGTTIRTVRSLSYRELGSRLFYVGCNGPGVFVSTDDGATWTAMNMGLPTTNVRVVAVESDIHTVQILAGTTAGGVFASSGPGVPWRADNAGLGSLSILALKQLGGFVYAGTQAGLWRRTIMTDVNQVSDAPVAFVLHQNFPNPFNASTTIAFDLSNDALVSLTLHTLLGQQISTLVHERRAAGTHHVRVTVPNLSSGVYVYKLIADSRSATRTLTVLK